MVSSDAARGFFKTELAAASAALWALSLSGNANAESGCADVLSRGPAISSDSELLAPMDLSWAMLQNPEEPERGTRDKRTRDSRARSLQCTLE